MKGREKAASTEFLAEVSPGEVMFKDGGETPNKSSFINSIKSSGRGFRSEEIKGEAWWNGANRYNIIVRRNLFFLCIACVIGVQRRISRCRARVYFIYCLAKVQRFCSLHVNREIVARSVPNWRLDEWFVGSLIAFLIGCSSKRGFLNIHEHCWRDRELFLLHVIIINTALWTFYTFFLVTCIVCAVFKLSNFS